MDLLDNLCEVCYGLAIDCSHCIGTGLQPTITPWDSGDCPFDSRSSGPDNSPHPLVEDYTSREGYAKHLNQNERASEFYEAALGQSSEKPSHLVTLEQKDEIPAYRRHTKSKAQVKLLKDWFAANPNPTGPQLSEYAKLASLEKDQVRNWFANQRRSSRKPLSKNTSKAELKQKTSNKGQPKQFTTSSSTKPIPIGSRSHTSSLTSSLKSIPDAPDSMLERWLDSFVDDLDILQVSHLDGGLDGNPSRNTSALAKHFQAMKAYQQERNCSWRSAASSIGSAASISGRSDCSSISIARRKYKNNYRRSDSKDQNAYYHHSFTPLPPPPQSQEDDLDWGLLIHQFPTLEDPFLRSSEFLSRICWDDPVLGDMGLFDEPEDISTFFNEDPILQYKLNRNHDTGIRMSQTRTKQSHSCQRYRCESCTHRFNTEEEWRMHETVVHRPREEWVCSLVPCMDPTWKDWKCAFCRSLFTDWEIFKLHRCQPCGVAPTLSTSKPVFNTRTALADHVKHHHEGAVLTSFMVKQWSRPPTWKEGIWSCGTCGSALQGWENRLNHLAGHFQLDMLKTECSCFTSSSMSSAMSGDVHCKNGKDTSSPDLDLGQLPNSVNIQNQESSKHGSSGSLFARARAWITRRVRGR